MGKKYKELLNMLANARSETLQLVENNIQTLQTDKVQQNKTPFQVPPINAPTQEKYVRTEILQQKQRKCAWAPVCSKDAYFCGGWRKESCLFKDQFKHISAETLQKAKRDMQNDKKRNRMRAERGPAM